MNNIDETISKNSKWFKGFTILPLIVTIVIASFFFVFGIVMGATIPTYDYYGSPVFNGGSMLLFWVIGAVAAAISYCLLKVVCSFFILNITYLRKLCASTNISNNDEATDQPRPNQQRNECLENSVDFTRQPQADNEHTTELPDDMPAESNCITVTHKKFGEGKIVKLDKTNQRVVVEFSKGTETFVYPDCFIQNYLIIKSN